ncbi:MAG: peptide ABC transporter substrate-binding protein, partial [Nevskiales bacterium]
MRKASLIALLLGSVLITACGNKQEDGELTARNKPLVLEDGRSVLRRGNGAEPETLDPHRAQSVTSSNILRDLYEGLVGEAPDGRLIPGAAERWEVSSDGKTYVFHLRKDASWSNGDPVTAEDFAYGLRRCVDPATGSPYAEILAPIVNTKAIINGEKPPESLGVTALDAHTLQINLKAPTPYFLGLLTHSSSYPAHQGSVKQHGDAFTQPGNHVTNGAYVISEWVVASHIRLERNKHYWDNANTGIDIVKYLPIDNVDSEFKRYLAGELDMTGSIPIPRLEWAKKNLQQDYRTYPSLAVYYYGLNTTKAPFKESPALRRALSLAVDRRIITEKVTRGGELPAYSWVPPGVSNYTPQKTDYAQWPREKQISEAQRLYNEAGYSQEKPLEIELRYNTSEGHKKIATAIASMWKTNLGAKVTLINEEWKVFLANVKTRKITQVYR